MEISAAVAANLAALTDALDGPGADLQLLVQRLADSCARAVGSYLGCTLTVVVDGVGRRFSVLEDRPGPNAIGTSVRFALGSPGELAPGSEVILYAGQPGAFVDLAADLDYAMGAGSGAVQLDRHLTAPDPALGAAELTALSRHNQAIGILLDQGHDQAGALVELLRLARRDAVSVQTAGQRLIDSLGRPPDG